MVKKPNLKLVINLIHLIALRIYFKKQKLSFRCNFEFLIANDQESQNPNIILLKIRLDCGKPQT